MSRCLWVFVWVIVDTSLFAYASQMLNLTEVIIATKCNISEQKVCIFCCSIGRKLKLILFSRSRWLGLGGFFSSVIILFYILYFEFQFFFLPLVLCSFRLLTITNNGEVYVSCRLWWCWTLLYNTQNSSNIFSDKLSFTVSHTRNTWFRRRFL